MKFIFSLLLVALNLFLQTQSANCDIFHIPSLISQSSAQLNKDLIGGWLINETLMISSYRSRGIYRLQLEKIISRDANGVPIPLVLDKMSFPLNKTDYISRGSGYCHLISGRKDPNLVVLINKKGIYKAWTILKLKFKELPIKGIKCILGDEDGVEI